MPVAKSFLHRCLEICKPFPNLLALRLLNGFNALFTTRLNQPESDFLSVGNGLKPSPGPKAGLRATVNPKSIGRCGEITHEEYT
jgi:hypothetical protein